MCRRGKRGRWMDHSCRRSHPTVGNLEASQTTAPGRECEPAAVSESCRSVLGATAAAVAAPWVLYLQRGRAAWPHPLYIALRPPDFQSTLCRTVLGRKSSVRCDTSAGTISSRGLALRTPPLTP